MTITATQLRKNIYKVIDRVAATGVPVTVTRKGQCVLLVPFKNRSRMSRLKKRDVIKCLPEALVHMDWSKAWKPFI